MSFQQVKQFASGMASDISVLKSIWFKKLDGESHADRLDNFYKNQAEACKRGLMCHGLVMTRALTLECHV